MKITFPKQFLLLVILFSLCGCTEKFESEKWQNEENGLYGENHRKKMLPDLIENVLFFPNNKKEKGTKKKEVVKLLGKPFMEDCDGNDTYEIEEKQGSIDPNGFVRLKLIYDQDSTLRGYVIEDGNYLE